MSVVDVHNIQGEKVSQVNLADSIFNVELKKSVLHDVVKMQLASRRKGNASVKHRSDVVGSQRKLFRQKGTGRARMGNIKSPILRGGGVAFGPDPKNYSYKVPKKVRTLALKMALTSKLKEDELLVLENIELETIKTKKCLEVVDRLKVNNALIIISERNEKLELSARNLPNIKVLRAEGLNVFDILKYKHLVLVESSIKAVEGRLLK